MNIKNDFNIQMAKRKTNASLRSAIREISKREYYEKLNNDRKIIEVSS